MNFFFTIFYHLPVCRQVRQATLLLLSFLFASNAHAQFAWAKAIGGTSYDCAYSIALDAAGNVYTTGYFTGKVDFDPGADTFNLTSAGNEDIFISKLDAVGKFVWAKALGGIGEDFGNSITLDASGNVYTTGSFQDTVDFDPGAGTSNLTSEGSNDIFISKLDSAGKFVWAKAMGGTYIDGGRSITLDASGNVYTTGSFMRTADFDPGAGTFNLTSAGSSEGIFISKLDTAGKFVWAKAMGGSSDDYGISIAVDASGNVYTTGYFTNTTDFDPGADTFSVVSAGSRDIFISKLDSAGKFVWAKVMGESSQDEGSSIAIDAAGNVYTTGYFWGIVDFDPGAGTFNLTSASGGDIFISKLDTAGKFVWAKAMGGTSTEIGRSITLDASCNVYTTGFFWGTVDFDPGAGTFNLTSVGGGDIFISKLDTAGKFVWAKAMGGIDDEGGRSIALDASGNVYTTGSFQDTADFDPGAGTFNLTSAGYTDIFVHKMVDCSGASATSSTISVSACNSYIFNGIALSSSGTYYDTLANAIGCDSIITLNLTINKSTGITIYDTACSSYSFKGNTITSSGIYDDTLTNALGCDSVVTLHLIIQNTNFSLAFTQNTQVFTTPPFDVLFLNTTPNKNNYTFTWLFGDGTYYNGTNPPKHTYQANGTYDVTLIAQNNTTGCTDTLYKQGWILCSGGCTHTAQIMQSNIAKKCSGDSIYLSCVSDSAYTYQWLYNGIKIQGATDSFIYVKTAGQYAVMVTDSNCPLTSAAVVIDFYPLATKPKISYNGSLVFCTGGSVELYINNIYNTYSWNTGSQTYRTYVTNSGTYFVNVTDTNGCKAQSDTFSLNASFISPPAICLVSVDSATNKNIIIWEKANAGSIDSFVVLKETSQANIYNMIGKLPYSAFSTFVDTASNPNVQANRYKLQAIDTCGITTLPSDYHKTMHLTINKGQGTNWNLIWSHYEGIQFSSYNIYRGSSSTTISLLTTIASNLNSYTDINPPSGNLFYQIEVVNPQGCTPSQKTYSYSSSKSNIADVGTIGIANLSNTQYTIFPNPTTSQLTIQSSKKLSNTTIKLYNITGQIIIQKTNLSGDNFTIDLAEYAKGIYILEIDSGEGVERVKIVKE